jgi:hypothetical protein
MDSTGETRDKAQWLLFPGSAYRHWCAVHPIAVAGLALGLKRKTTHVVPRSTKQCDLEQLPMSMLPMSLPLDTS